MTMFGLIGARSPTQARGVLAWRIRRRISWAALNANASLKLQRCDFVGPGGPQAARRRQRDAEFREQRRQSFWYNAARCAEEVARQGQRNYTSHHV